MGDVRRIVAAVAVVSCLVGLPQNGRAQASMSAKCVGTGGACDQVVFKLVLDGLSTFNLMLTSSDMSIWSFQSVDKIAAGPDQVDVTDMWVVTAAPSFSTASYGPGMLEPIWMYVTMSSWGEESQLYNHNISFAVLASDNQLLSGYVTPEPESLVLVATGLLGLAWMTRRRKKFLGAEG